MTLGIIYCRIAELKPDPANPRHHTKKQIRQIADSIKTFGFNVPILVDCDGKIIAGHGRYDAARLIGMTDVPALCLDHLTAAQARAFMIADTGLPFALLAISSLRQEGSALLGPGLLVLRGFPVG